MLIDLHAHVGHPGFYNQHPHWGPFWEEGADGEIRLRVGHWVLSLGQPERKQALRAGKAMKLAEWLERCGNPKFRLADMDAAGQDAQVLSVPSHCYMYWADPDFTIRYANKVNEVLAQYCSQGDSRLFFWAHAPLNSPKDCPAVIRRAVKELGAVGMSAGGSNFGGLEFDSPELFPVWETLCDLDLPIFVHGYNQSVTWGSKANDDRYETTAIVGMNYDETKCFWYLVCGGVLDRFPNLKVYITHAGGYVPYQLGRLEETAKNLDVTHNKLPLRAYLKNFWFDPEIHEPGLRQAMVDLIGADRLLYGTNFGGSDAIRFDMTADLKISQEDKDKIRSANAIRLLHLDPNKIGRARAKAVA